MVRSQIREVYSTQKTTEIIRVHILIHILIGPHKERHTERQTQNKNTQLYTKIDKYALILEEFTSFQTSIHPIHVILEDRLAWFYRNLK